MGAIQKWTAKEHRFIQLYTNPKSETFDNIHKSAKAAGWRSDTSAYRFLDRPFTKYVMRRMYENLGLTKGKIAQKIAQGMNLKTKDPHKDAEIALKYIDMYRDIMGEKVEKVEHKGNVQHDIRPVVILRNKEVEGPVDNIIDVESEDEE